MFAATHPERTTALIEFATYARMAVAPDYPQGSEVDALRGFLAIMEKEWGSPALLKLWAPSLAEDEEAGRWWARLLRNGSGPGGIEELCRQMYEQIDVRPLLPPIKVPSLIMWRAGDRVIPAAQSRVVAEGIPGAKAVELPGRGSHRRSLETRRRCSERSRSSSPASAAGRPPERALATVLFTDIVGSTERAASLGDLRWRRAPLRA